MLNNILLTLIIVITMLVNIHHALHMFQQNRYEFQRYTDWLIANKLKNVRFWATYIAFMAAVIFAGIWLGLIYALWVAVIIACVRLYLHSKEEYIKPLVYTSRVKRQIFVLLAVDFLIYYFCFSVNTDLLTIIMIALSLYLNLFTLYLMAGITAPVEKRVRNHYKKQAEKIIDEHKNLIKIGITGSYGKTSSKNILQQVLSENFYSLMTPASYNTPMGITRTIRSDLKRIHEVFICEMGADHVGDIEELMLFVKPQYGIVTSIGPQHLQTFGSLENIIQEKMKEVELLPVSGTAFLNMDNEHIRNYKIINKCKKVSVAIDYPDVDFKVENIVYNTEGSEFDIVNNNQTYHFKTTLLGKHNISNILLAVACARELGVAWEALYKSVKATKQIEHRLELKKINGYRFIDNAFNSNPAGANMSLEVMSMMPNKRYIVTPGLIDLGEQQDQLNKEFGMNMLDKVDVVILVGKNQTVSIYKGLKESGFNMENVHVVDKVNEAFAKVYSMATKEDTILLENDLPDAFNN